MKRLMIDFDKQQLSWLAEKAVEIEASKSHVVRRIIDWYAALDSITKLKDLPNMDLVKGLHEVYYGDA